MRFQIFWSFSMCIKGQKNAFSLLEGAENWKNCIFSICRDH